MLRENYDLMTIISAVVTLVITVSALRLALYLANRNKTTIQKPDWVEDDKFDIKRNRKRK